MTIWERSQKSFLREMVLNISVGMTLLGCRLVEPHKKPEFIENPQGFVRGDDELGFTPIAEGWYRQIHRGGVLVIKKEGSSGYFIKVRKVDDKLEVGHFEIFSLSDYSKVVLSSADQEHIWPCEEGSVKKIGWNIGPNDSPHSGGEVTIRCPWVFDLTTVEGQTKFQKWIH